MKSVIVHVLLLCWLLLSFVLLRQKLYTALVAWIMVLFWGGVFVAVCS